MNFEYEVLNICGDISDMLIRKNKAYGNSSLVPLRIFSKADPIEQIKVRIDDKLSRLMRGNNLNEVPEDTVNDLIGYLILLKIANKKEESVPQCGKPLVYTKEMLISSLESKEDDKGDNNKKEVIQEKHDNIGPMRKIANAFNKPQILIEVPAFETNGCSHHKCNNSQYWTTADGRIKIDPPEPYNVAIYTTVAEIQRLRAMDGKELQVVMRAYEKQTYANKRYALRAFLRDIAGDYFPSIPSDYVTPTVTPEPIAESPLPEVTATPKPEGPPVNPYVFKTHMNKRTAELWKQFAKPTPEITKDDNAPADLSK